MSERDNGMIHEKLRGWLKLADGPWPPDYYALIGLQLGAGTPDEIEGRVLERLELLRRYQLPHPDEATEGMNLLARALDTLTDPDGRKAYDRSIGIRSAARVEPQAPPADEGLNALFPGVPLLPARADAPAQALDDEPLPEAIVLPAMEEELDVDDDPEFVDEVAAPELPDAILLPVLPAVARLADEQVRPATRPKSPRRELYADLARVRKVLRIFERARPYLTDTDRTFARRTEAIGFMGCLAELRPLLPTVSDLIAAGHRPGNIVASLARQRLLFETFRTLLPSQRDSLAKDFRAAHYRLAAYYDELRDEARRATEKGWMRTVGRPVLKYLADHPEWLLLPVALVALAVALVRSV
jgi:hypothetical protein